MTALAKRSRRSVPTGSTEPRLAPPLPLIHGAAAFTAIAKRCGYELYPWQAVAARYLTATSRRHHLYQEVAIVVGRQNGKTTLLVPLIISRLLAGRSVVHAAQNLKLPREIHDEVATLLLEHWPEVVPPRGKGIRYGAGDEQIRLSTGGHYRIVAATRGGARGPATDLVIVDELREMETDEFIAAAKPSLSASLDPQMVYLSNAGTEDSVVLNALRARRDDDPSLAYLEWSADPDLADDDPAGWLQANPAIGHRPQKYENVEREYRANKLGGTLALFETEYLCRWVVSTKPALLDMELWESRAALLGAAVRPVMGLALDPDGARVSAAIAWQRNDGTFGLRVVADVRGDPVDLDTFGPQAVALATSLGCRMVVYDPYDEHLARHFHRPIAMNGRDFANACASFVRLLEADQLHHEKGEPVAADIAWTTRRNVGPGAWMAVKANDDHPVTAVLAAIRAVGAVYGPRSIGLRVR